MSKKKRREEGQRDDDNDRWDPETMDGRDGNDKLNTSEAVQFYLSDSFWGRRKFRVDIIRKSVGRSDRSCWFRHFKRRSASHVRVTDVRFAYT